MFSSQAYKKLMMSAEATIKAIPCERSVLSDFDIDSELSPLSSPPLLSSVELLSELLVVANGLPEVVLVTATRFIVKSPRVPC